MKKIIEKKKITYLEKQMIAIIKMTIIQVLYVELM